MELTPFPTEQTSALTDALLAVLAVACAMYLVGFARRDAWKAYVWTGAFSLLALTAALGALSHGFMMTYGMFQQLWWTINAALGQVIALFVAGAVTDGWGRRVALRALPALAVLGLLFFGVTLLFPDSFLVFIAYELVAMFFALAVYARLAWRRALPGAGLMVAGIVLSIVAAVIQASGSFSLALIWEFDQNGLFHLLQMPAILFLLAGLRAAFVYQTDNRQQAIDSRQQAAGNKRQTADSRQ